MKGFLDRVLDYQKEILGVVAVALALGAGYYFYRQHQVHRQEQAHRALSEVLYEFMQATQGATAWDDVGIAALAGYRQHKSSALAPYFLSVQADVAVHKGEFEQAIKIMDTLLHDLSSSSPLYPLYKLKHARMLIDSSDDQIAAAGLKALELLAKDSSAVQDAASYYLGSYYAARNDLAHAHDIWKSLIEKFGSKRGSEGSPWAELAQTQL